jgi:hypothetical protein
MKYITQLSIVFSIACVIFSASGQTTNVILQTDFDGDAGMGNGGGCGGYAGAGSGYNGGSSTPPLPYTAAVVAGIGVGGTSAAQIIGDFSDLATDPVWQDAVGYVYYNLNLTTSFYNPITPLTPLTDVSGLSNLVLTANLQLSGLLPGQYGANVYISQVQFQDVDGVVIFDFTGYGVWAPISGFANLQVPLSSLTYAAPGAPAYGDAQNPVTDFTNAAVLASIVQINVQFQLNANDVVGSIGNNIMPVFGFTNAAGLVADNVMLVQIVNTNTAPPPPPTPTVEQTVWQANFDTTFPNNYTYSFHDRDGTDNATGVVAINPAGGVGGSASLEYTVDLSSWSSTPPASYSGFGLGANESPLATTLASASAASYRVFVSAKVGGTSAGVTSVPGNLDLNFFTPLGQQVMDMTESVTLSNTWQSFVLSNLHVATWNPAFQTLFNQNYNTNVNTSELQLSIVGSPNVGTLFGYDANNTVDIDNIKVVQLVPGLAPVTIIQNGGQTQITWSDPTTGGTAKLQSTTNIAGPYLDVAGASSAASSPYTVPSGGKQQFYRTVWVP